MTREEAIEKLNLVIEELEAEDPYDTEEAEAMKVLEKDHQQFLSWGSNLRDLMNHPAVQEVRQEKEGQCVFCILKKTLDKMIDSTLEPIGAPV